MSFNTKLATAVLTGLISSAFIAAVPANAAGNMPMAEKTQQAEKEKHACKGQNSCAGNGGDGKNACKGHGSCATDGSKK
jgi:hypothetical protein